MITILREIERKQCNYNVLDFYWNYFLQVAFGEIFEAFS